MKILVVKLADLGDLLLSEPALRSLRSAYPDARIDVLTTPHAASLLPHLDDQATAITLDKSPFDVPGLGTLQSGLHVARLASRLRYGRYDRVAILHHLTTDWGTAKYRALARATGSKVVAGLDNGRGSFLTHGAIDRGFGYKHESEYMLDVALAAGGAETTPEPSFNIGSDSLPFELPDSFVAIAPSAGSYSAARIWPVERFIDLSQRLVNAGHSVVIVGGEDATITGEVIVDQLGRDRAANITAQTSLNQLAITLQRSRLLVGNDSFPVHLASAVGTPALAIFGPTNLDAWQPIGERSRAVSARLSCSPCLYTGYRLGRPEGCPARTCLDLITPEIVLESTMELLRA